VKSKGHPIRGAIAGLFFGLFLSLDLLIFGVVALDANILAILPILGLIAGTALGMAAPLQRGKTQPAAPPSATAAVEAAPPEPAPVEAPAPDHSTV
jgi:hypothetical protein